MIRKRHIINKDTITQDQKSLGISATFTNTSIFTELYSYKEQVKSKFLNLVLTEPGEVPFKPLFGVGLRSLLFENAITKEDISFRIQDKLDLYIPDIELIEIKLDRSENTVTINIYYEITSLKTEDSINISLNV